MASGLVCSSADDACRLKWLNSIAKFMKETQSSSLNLSGRNINVDVLKLLLKYLPGWQVLTELILKDNNLGNGMKELAKVLPQTNIKKLNVSNCELEEDDYFDLMETLKDTKITELFIDGNEVDYLPPEEGDRFVALTLASHLEIFDYGCVDMETDFKLFQVLPSTSLTQLDLQFGADSENLLILFSNLPQSSLISLQMDCYEERLDANLMRKLSHNLSKSLLEKLTLNCKDINDRLIDILTEGLVHSKVVDLDISGNKIRGSNTLGLRLKDTQIKKLKLSRNRLDQYGMFLCPDFLRCSSVTDLDVSHCQLDAEHFEKIMESIKFSNLTNLNVSYNNLEELSISEFAENVKDTNLEKVDFSGNELSPDEFIILAECIKSSKLSHIDLSKCFTYPDGGTLLPVFVAEVKGSSLDSVKFMRNELNERGAKILAAHLVDISFTRFDLSGNQMGNGITSLAEHLKFSPLTHLCLSRNEISDEGVGALAEHLKETQLIDLQLNSNLITCLGAKALSASLKNSTLLHLELSDNKIGNDGIEALTQGAENTFITVLDVSDNPGDHPLLLLLDAALWENKTAVHRLVNTFKQIAPKTLNDSFCFDRNLEHQNADEFLENCLELVMNLTQKPSAVRVLLEEKSTALSKEEIISVVSGKFPEQFCQFVASRVEADVKQQVGLLKSAESKGLSKVVELSLLNRPLYLIDETEGILHPDVYRLLNKYNQPLFNLAVEPDGKIKIMNYFTEHAYIEGATDVIRLLRGKRKL